MAKKKISVPEPEEGLKFIDVHCHLPFPRPKKKDVLPSNEEQYQNFIKSGGLFMITSTIDAETLQITLNFLDKHSKHYGYTCGWAPQTVTYTPENKHKKEFKKWLSFISENDEEYLGIGEIGLDFHHAKTLSKREKQIQVLKQIFRETKDLGKPYILHVRNAAPHEKDKKHPNHRFNEEGGANQEILGILEEFSIKPKSVMWHCFSGPEAYGKQLSEQGFTLSVPSSAYGFNRWRKMSKNAKINSLVTETDSYYQHPFKRGPVNVPLNVRYSIAAIAHTHNLSQKEVSIETVKNAVEFFDLDKKLLD